MFTTYVFIIIVNFFNFCYAYPNNEEQALGGMYVGLFNLSI